MTSEEQAEIIKLYFASPSDGGHGYVLGRVPMNSCDFSPKSYSFDDATCPLDDSTGRAKASHILHTCHLRPTTAHPPPS